MKKYITAGVYAAAALAAATVFASCEGGKDERHYTAVGKQYIETFADQVTDSLKVQSYDSWTLTNQNDWFKVLCGTQTDNISVKVPASTLMQNTLYISLTPNTTGQTRYASLQVSSSYGSTVSTTLMQYPFLNVQRPAPVTSSATHTTTFTATLAAKPTGTQTVVFTVYTEGATLASSDESWLKPEKTEGFKAGEQTTVSLSVEENTSAQERTATLTLTSGGVSTPITVTQQGTGE